MLIKRFKPKRNKEREPQSSYFNITIIALNIFVFTIQICIYCISDSLDVISALLSILIDAFAIKIMIDRSDKQDNDEYNNDSFISKELSCLSQIVEDVRVLIFIGNSMKILKIIFIMILLIHMSYLIYELLKFMEREND